MLYIHERGLEIFMGKSFFKYIFVVVVIILASYTIYKSVKEDSEAQNESLDQTSKVSTIQKDIRLSIAELDTINPILSNNKNVQEITKIIYEPLVTLNENYKMEYCLATEIAKQDDVTYLVKLRQGVLWHDRSNFSAWDVRFTVDRILGENSVSTIYRDNLRYVSSLEVVDDYTVIIRLTQAVPFFEYNLTFPIMCASYYDGEDFATTDKNYTPIGTGMFKIESREPGYIKLARNDEYWDNSKKPMAEEVNISLYDSMGEVYNSFKSGELDIITVGTNSVEQYIGTLGYNKVEYKSRNYDFLSLNNQSRLFSDVNVRRAISLVIDKNAIVAGALGSGYTPSNFWLDMGNWLYIADLTVETNTEEARNILEQNGWALRNNIWIKDGQRLEFPITVSNESEARLNVAQIICEQLNNFGINASILEVSGQRYEEILNNKSYECLLTGVRMSFTPSLRTFFGEGNIANYNNVEVFDLIRKVENTNDEGEMYDSYRAIYQKYLDDVPYIGLYRDTDIVVYNQGLVGNISPNAFNLYHNIEKWYRQ